MKQRPEGADSREITTLLNAWAGGKGEALDDLMPLVEVELRRLARSYMRREPRDHTLQTTALVNEAYLRLVGQKDVRWQSRAHFFAIAAKLMRRILVDHARKRRASKRGADHQRVPLHDVNQIDLNQMKSARPEEVLALHQALLGLEEVSPRQSGIVELRHFGGLNNREIAAVLEISVATVKREWTVARAWLYHQLSTEPLAPEPLQP